MLVARSQLKNETTIDYFYDKIRLCSDLELSFEETKTQLLEGFYSQGMITYLLSRQHNDTDSILDDILTYERLNKVRSTRFKSNNSSDKQLDSNSTLLPKTNSIKKNERLMESVRSEPKRCFN